MHDTGGALLNEDGQRVMDCVPLEHPLTARAIADSLGENCLFVVPLLNSLLSNGLVRRVSIGESGLVGWRLP
jgi:hypothetical protein